MTKITGEVEDAGDGRIDINLRCEKSGKKITRSTKLGMFCDEPDCECEKQAKLAAEELTGMLRELGFRL